VRHTFSNAKSPKGDVFTDSRAGCTVRINAIHRDCVKVFLFVLQLRLMTVRASGQE